MMHPLQILFKSCLVRVSSKGMNAMNDASSSNPLQIMSGTTSVDFKWMVHRLQSRRLQWKDHFMEDKGDERRGILACIEEADGSQNAQEHRPMACLRCGEEGVCCSG